LGWPAVLADAQRPGSTVTVHCLIYDNLTARPMNIRVDSTKNVVYKSYRCGAVLIGRDWYDITAWHLSADGRCVACGTPCHGVFEATAGRWGARRLSLKLRTATSAL
jgi:hypothetical protein